MGHDLHFLSRLSRVSHEHTELALSLYRDPGLVRDVFRRSQVPEGAERVAISLDHPEDGPFLVLARDGGFVTCLGPGMSPGELPLITRAKLDSVASQLATLRDRLDQARQVAGDAVADSSLPLVRRLIESPEQFTREDVAGLRAWLPLAGPALASWAIFELQKIRLLAARARSRDETASSRAILRTHLGLRIEALSIAIPLLACDAHRWIDAVPADGRDDVLKSFAVCPELMITARALARQLNGIAHGGRRLLPMVKELARTIPEATVDALDAIGQAHPNLRAEIAKVLARIAPDDSPPLERWRGREDFFRTFSDSEAAKGAFNSLPGFADPDALLAQVLFYKLRSDQPVREGEMRNVVLASLHGIVVVEPESLYPAADLALTPLDLGRTADLVIDELHGLFRPDPVRRDPGPGRNDPCACGSGRKSKKCCGA